MLTLGVDGIEKHTKFWFQTLLFSIFFSSDSHKARIVRANVDFLFVVFLGALPWCFLFLLVVSIAVLLLLL